MVSISELKDTLTVPAITSIRVNGDKIEYKVDGETITTTLPDRNTWIGINDSMDTMATTMNKFVDMEGLRAFRERLLREIYSIPLVEHTCHNCGAKLEVESDKHIFHCKYCGSCYAFGTNMING